MNCGCVNTCTCNNVTLGVTNGFLTVTVGGSSDTVDINTTSIGEGIFTSKEFNVNTGNSVDIVDTPITSLGFKVYRNGKLVNISSYVLSGHTVTFVIGFGNSVNAQGTETISVEYYK